MMPASPAVSGIDPRVQAAIARLAHLDPAHPHIDHDAAEQAIARYLRAVGLPQRPVRWFPDARSAYAHAAARAKRAALTSCAAWIEQAEQGLGWWDAARRAAFNALSTRSDRTSSLRAAWVATTTAAKAADWFPHPWSACVDVVVRGAKAAAAASAMSALERNWDGTAWAELDAAFAAALAAGAGGRRLTQTAANIVMYVIWWMSMARTVWREHRAALETAASTTAWDAAQEAARAALWSRAWCPGPSRKRERWNANAVSTAAESVRSAARAVALAGVGVDPADPSDRDMAERIVAIWLPFLDAFEAGLFFCWITPRDILCVPKASLSVVNGRLHREDGPAVAWPTGERYWFWRGVPVPDWVIEDPGSITPKTIRDEYNQERRRCLIERFGTARFIREAGAELISHDQYGHLWRCNFGDDDPYTLVEVVNGTPRPDGTRTTYFISVPPEMETAHQAVAWTYGLSPEQYQHVERT
jgi:hypothetical protein